MDFIKLLNILTQDVIFYSKYGINQIATMILLPSVDISNQQLRYQIDILFHLSYSTYNTY
jgi:hypothetical protein